LEPRDLDELRAELNWLHSWQLIGSGGSAVVYSAIHETLGRTVAVKVPFDRVDRADRFAIVSEARALAVLSNHPNIVNVHNCGATRSGLAWIEMGFAERGSLAELLARYRCELSDVARVVTEIAKALDAAHAEGLVHCDVKPANVLIDKADRVQLSDFGIVSRVSDRTEGQRRVSRGYASPEALLAEPVSPATDQWMLAATACHMFVGRPPFDGTQAQDRGAIDAIVEEAVAAAGPLVDPSRMRTVLRRALDQSPARRFASCSDFAHALDGALAVSDSDPGAADDETREYRASATPRRSHRRVLAATSVAVAIVAAAIAVNADSDDGTIDLATGPSSNRVATTPTNGPGGSAAGEAEQLTMWVGGPDAAMRVDLSTGDVLDRVSTPSAFWTNLDDGGAVMMVPKWDRANSEPRIDELVTFDPNSATPTRIELPAPAGQVIASSGQRGRLWLMRQRAALQPVRMTVVDLRKGEVIGDFDMPSDFAPLMVTGGAVLDDDTALISTTGGFGVAPAVVRVHRDGRTERTSVDGPEMGLSQVVVSGSSAWLVQRPPLVEVAGETRDTTTVARIDSEAMTVDDPVEIDPAVFGRGNPMAEEGGVPNGSFGRPDGSLVLAGEQDGATVVTTIAPDGSTTNATSSEAGDLIAGDATSIWFRAEQCCGLVHYDGMANRFDAIAVDDGTAPPTAAATFSARQVGGQLVEVTEGQATMTTSSGDRRTLGAVNDRRFDLYLETGGGRLVVTDAESGYGAAYADGRWGDRLESAPICAHGELAAATLWCLTGAGTLDVVRWGAEPVASQVATDVGDLVSVDDDAVVVNVNVGDSAQELRALDPRSDALIAAYGDEEGVYGCQGRGVRSGTVLVLGCSQYPADGAETYTVTDWESGLDQDSATIDGQISDATSWAGGSWFATGTGVARVSPNGRSEWMQIVDPDLPLRQWKVAARVMGLDDVIYWVDLEAGRVAIGSASAGFRLLDPIAPIWDAAATSERLWLATSDAVVGYDRTGQEVARLDLPGVRSVEGSGDDLYALSDRTATISVVDPRTATVSETIAIAL